MTSTPTPSLERSTSLVADLPQNHESASPAEPTVDAAPFVTLRSWSWSESDHDDANERVPRPQSQSQDIDVRIQRGEEDTGVLMSTVGSITEDRSQEGQVASEQATEPEDTLSEDGGLDSDLRDSAAQLFIQINKDEALARRKGSKAVLITARS